MDQRFEQPQPIVESRPKSGRGLRGGLRWKHIVPPALAVTAALTTVAAFGALAARADGGGVTNNPNKPKSGELIPGAEIVREANGIHLEAHIACGDILTLPDGTQVKDPVEVAFLYTGKGLSAARFQRVPLNEPPAYVTWEMGSGKIEGFGTGVVNTVRDFGTRYDHPSLPVQAGKGYLLEIHKVDARGNTLTLQPNPDVVSLQIPECPAPEVVKFKTELESLGVKNVHEVQRISKNAAIQFEANPSPTHQLHDVPVESTGNFVSQMFSPNEIVRISPDQEDRENYVVTTKGEKGETRKWFVVKANELRVETDQKGHKMVRDYPQDRFAKGLMAVLLEGHSQYEGPDQNLLKAHLNP